MRIPFILLLFFSSFQLLHSQDGTSFIEKTDDGILIGDLVEMSGTWYIAYQNIMTQDLLSSGDNIDHINRFVLKRSYFTLKKDLNDVFSVRYTMDLTIDEEGEDSGNVETRLKYLYLKVEPKITSKIFTGTYFEAGMVHEPWLSYEQSINSYRVQDNMFIERNRMFSSADLGVMIAGNIGPKMDKQFLSEVNDAMKGKYLSYIIGVYNGGGYSALENNLNKVVSGRLSYRPLPEIRPEIQVSVFGTIGKGNIAESPDYRQFLGFLTYAGRQLTLVGQFHTGVGDSGGRYIRPFSFQALKNDGYSFFAEYKFGKSPWAIWGRYDRFQVEQNLVDETRLIGGVTYKVNNMIRIVLDTEYREAQFEKESIYELNLEIVF